MTTENHHYKGKFIAIEGGEGSGKTTLLETLRASLNKKYPNVVWTRSPGGTSIGKQVRDILLSLESTGMSPRAELFLFLADRAQHVDEIITPNLEKGKIVICDRFFGSTYAYQGFGRKLSLTYLVMMDNYARDNVSPNLNILLDIDPVVGLERLRKSRTDQTGFEKEKIDFLQRVREGFLELAKQDPQHWLLIDASKSQKEVFEEAMKGIMKVLNKNYK